MSHSPSRRSFLATVAVSATAAERPASAQKKQSQGEEATEANDSPEWTPVSDRKIRVGLVGYGLSSFGAAFGFQDHPNVEVVAVSDLFDERCANLAKACRCEKTYPSLEEMVKDDQIEAIFVATDAPSHPRHCSEVLRHGKHVACAVPASYGSLEEADMLFDAVKETGLKYMMFETSCFHEDLHAMRQIYHAGGFGKLTYSEGEYFHFFRKPLPSYKGWRDSGIRHTPMPTTSASPVGVSPRSPAWAVPPLGGRRTTATRTRSVPKSPSSVPAKGACHAWASAGIHPVTAARGVGFADSRDLSMVNTRAWKRTCPSPAGHLCHPVSRAAVTVAHTANS